MPTKIIEESATTYSTGVLGGTVGMVGNIDLITFVSGLLIAVRFTYDTVRFIHYVNDRYPSWYKFKRKKQKKSK